MAHTFLDEARVLTPWLEDIFHRLHQNPELGRQEHATAALIMSELDKLGIEASPIADTGVLGIIRGGKPGKTVCFRADMDALPIQEETGLPYASRIPGVMHACGHDFHVTTLLGAAALLAKQREELQGNIKLFFQPDEEGDGGAERMVGEGCMENPHADAVFFGHTSSAHPAGTVSVISGPSHAASNPFEVIFRGKGTHAASPHAGNDVIVAASHAVIALQTISSRRFDPTDPVVVTVGAFHAGLAGNVIPEEAKLTGIIRTLSPRSRQKAKETFTSIVNGIASAMEVEAEIRIKDGYGSNYNDPAMTALVRTAAAKVIGPENVIEQQAPSLGTDDFCYFTEKAPGSYFHFGVSNEQKGFTCPGHNPRFAVDPDALPAAAAVYAQIASDYLNV